MDIIMLVNALQPNTIQRLSLVQKFNPDTGQPLYTPFMDAFVELFDGATLPDPAAVMAYEANYNAAQALQASNQVIKQQIDALEATQTPRRIREGGQWLADLNTQISALRAQLK